MKPARCGARRAISGVARSPVGGRWSWMGCSVLSLSLSWSNLPVMQSRHGEQLGYR